MTNVLIFSDLHINQSSLKECASILEEISALANKYQVDTLISLGDTFDSIKPSSLELDLLANFIKKLNKKLIIIAADSHESTTKEESILNHFGILSDRVKILKEFKDNNHLYCGHFSLKESSKNYDAKISKEALKNYAYVFLGHLHSYEIIKPNICYLGSSRYVNFEEAKDKYKIVALITDYDSDTEKVHFLSLKSPKPMIELNLGKNQQNPPIQDLTNPKKVVSRASYSKIAPLEEALAQLDPKTKVKVKILDFESFREFLPIISKYETKFEVFKYETNFEVITEKGEISTQKELSSFKESFLKWLNNQSIDLKITEILQKEIE